MGPAAQQQAAAENKLQFAHGAEPALPSFDLRALGAVFSGPASSGAQPQQPALKLAGRCAFTVREGFDPLDEASTGRVLEGSGDAGVCVRRGASAFSVSAGNLGYRAGLDNPLACCASGEGSMPSLKLTVAQEYRPDCFAAVSYDARQKKPELSLAWAGRCATEQASLVLHADPVFRTYKMAASVAFAGPEWRETVYDEEHDVIQDPVDDGARHRLWVAHTVKDKQWGYRTRVGAVFDLGRLANYVADFVDYNVEPKIPPIFWRMPLSQTLFNVLVPAEDAQQVRHHFKGWDAEVCHEFGQPGAVVGLAKHLKYATLRATFDTASHEAGLWYRRSGIMLGAKIVRQRGASGGWSSPSLHLHVDPLGVL